jgi:hypothetical protein
MRNILLAIVVALPPASIAAAEQSGTPKPDKSLTSVRQLPVKSTATGDSCAAYGAGFVKVEGTDSCVKVGGAVRIEAGSSGR